MIDRLGRVDLRGVVHPDVYFRSPSMTVKRTVRSVSAFGMAYYAMPCMDEAAGWTGA